MQCPPLSDPENGSLDNSGGINVNSLARYNCDDGYDLVGTSIRICRSIGMWSGGDPTCQRELLLLKRVLILAVFFSDFVIITKICPR